MPIIIRTEQKRDEKDISAVLRQAFNSDDEVLLIERLPGTSIQNMMCLWKLS